MLNTGYAHRYNCIHKVFMLFMLILKKTAGIVLFNYKIIYFYNNIYTYNIIGIITKYTVLIVKCCKILWIMIIWTRGGGGGGGNGQMLLKHLSWIGKIIEIYEMYIFGRSGKNFW